MIQLPALLIKYFFTHSKSPEGYIITDLIAKDQTKKSILFYTCYENGSLENYFITELKAIRTKTPIRCKMREKDLLREFFKIKSVTNIRDSFYQQSSPEAMFNVFRQKLNEKSGLPENRFFYVIKSKSNLTR